MKNMGAIFTILIIGGIFYLLDNKKNNPVDKKVKNLLCLPSGEIINIKSYKFSQLKEHGYTKWSKKYKAYTITDKIRKTI